MAIKSEAELRKQLAKAIQERDDLQRDLEALCLSQSSDLTFSSSSVLQDRIIFTGEEARHIATRHSMPPALVVCSSGAMP